MDSLQLGYLYILGAQLWSKDVSSKPEESHAGETALPRHLAAGHCAYYNNENASAHEELVVEKGSSFAISGCGLLVAILDDAVMT